VGHYCVLDLRWSSDQRGLAEIRRNIAQAK
jgi:hypothetical protein